MHERGCIVFLRSTWMFWDPESPQRLELSSEAHRKCERQDTWVRCLKYQSTALRSWSKVLNVHQRHWNPTLLLYSKASLRWDGSLDRACSPGWNIKLVPNGFPKPKTTLKTRRTKLTETRKVSISGTTLTRYKSSSQLFNKWKNSEKNERWRNDKD